MKVMISLLALFLMTFQSVASVLTSPNPREPQRIVVHQNENDKVIFQFCLHEMQELDDCEVLGSEEGYTIEELQNEKKRVVVANKYFKAVKAVLLLFSSMAALVNAPTVAFMVGSSSASIFNLSNEEKSIDEMNEIAFSRYSSHNFELELNLADLSIVDFAKEVERRLKSISFVKECKAQGGCRIENQISFPPMSAL